MLSEGNQTCTCPIYSHFYDVHKLIFWTIAPHGSSSGDGEGNILLSAVKELPRVEGNNPYLDWMLVPGVHIFLKTHHRVHLRFAHYTICNYSSIKIQKMHTLIITTSVMNLFLVY